MKKLLNFMMKNKIVQIVQSYFFEYMIYEKKEELILINHGQDIINF